MKLGNLYANTKDTDFTINFFLHSAPSSRLGLLAAPFFTTTSPIDELTKHGCEVKLIVRFSPITTPDALRSAFENPRVKVRYFTDAKFHTKLYIIDNAALVGSANLTAAGLNANRELSILLKRDRDEAFEALPGHFDDLWNDADVLTDQILKEYARAFKEIGRPQDELEFEKHVHKFVKPASISSVLIGSAKKSRDRAFIQSFRHKYDEILVPAHNEILACALSNGFGRPEYRGQNPQIEMGRFLGWLRLTQGSGNGWRETELLRNSELRAERIKHYVEIWQSTDDTVKGDSYHAASEIENIAKIQKYLRDTNELKVLSFDEIFDCLIGCHAFLERLRFASKELGEDLKGVERLKIDFQSKNTHAAVVRTLSHLLSGPGDTIERAYDCIFGGYRLSGFGEACVMELLGWGDKTRPPFNNRSIRGIRLLGFDVEHLVAGD